MTRAQKIWLIVGGSLAGLFTVLLIAGILIVQTGWFRGFVREKIVSSVETATGGKVDVGSFAFEWRHLSATVRDFTIHGLEPAGAPPLFQARLVEADLTLISPFKGFVGLSYLLVDTPRVNVMVYPDGHTNVPSPKVHSTGNTTGLETIVDLAIGRFDLRNGSMAFGGRQSGFDASGKNLRAHLAYNTIKPGYAGQIDMSPLHIQSGKNPPVDVDVKLPLVFEKDRITLANARLSTPESEVTVSGSMDHLVAPRTSAHIQARLGLEEVKRAAGITTPLDTRRGPRVLAADIRAVMEQNRIQVQGARITLGHSDFEAAGTLEDPDHPGTLAFRSALALGEIGRLLGMAAPPEETVRLSGNARLEPNRFELSALKVAALGGSLTGAGVVENMSRFRFSGDLNGFNIEQAARALAGRGFGYGGVVSGRIEAEGNLKSTSDILARVNLGIAPGPKGPPLSGRLKVNYDGRADTVAIDRSYLALPHTRLDLSGSLGRQIQIHMVSRNLNDFRPLGEMPVTLNGGAANITATVSGKLSAPSIAGQIVMSDFSVQGRPFTRFVAGVSASKSGASITNGTLGRGPLQMQISAAVGLRNWKPDNDQPLRADLTIRKAGMRDVLALVGQAGAPVTGVLTADAHIHGTIGDPRGNADLSVTDGTVESEPFDRLAARVAMTRGQIAVPMLEWTAGPSRLDANAVYQHAPDNLRRGTLSAHVASSQLQLAQFQSLLKGRPGLRGVVSLRADATAGVAASPTGTEFQLTSISASASARGLEMEGRSLGEFTATANTAGARVEYDVNSNFAGSTIRVNGQSLLAGNHQTTASVSIANLPIERVLAVAGRRDLPVSGTLSADAQVSGTLQDPHATANLSLAKGSAYQEPFDRLQAAFGYSNQQIDMPRFRLDQGASYIEVNGSFAHPANNFADGQLRFRVRGNQLQLARLHAVQQYKPGLAGLIELTADGAATLRRNAAPLVSTLNASLTAKGLNLSGQPLGNLSATAETRGGEVALNLTSDFARANIRGSGRMGLAGEYPLDAQLTFSNLTYSGLTNWTGGGTRPFDASADGQVSVSGPVRNTDALRGTLRVTRLEAHSVMAAGREKPRVNLDLHNAGPLVATLDRGAITIQNARITGPSANFALTGTASMRGPGTLDVRADADVNLDALEAFDPDIFSSGKVVMNAAVTGTTAKPAITGSLKLQNASFNMLSLPNGLTNANGSVAFNGTEAVIQNITGESGGGKIMLSGLVAYGSPEMEFRLQATVNQVRVEYPETVSTQANARLTLAGNKTRSLLSGNVSILDVALHSHSDIGSMLTTAATPPSSPATTTGWLAAMRLDVRIQTAPNIQFRTTLTQNLQAEANLTLRGNVARPGMLGRITVARGDVVFFGAKYTVGQGTISFFNPQKINPILHIDLETTIQGVDVVLSVSGPMDRMKLSYRSDPPMEFSDLISLLASGKTPSTDPVLAAHEPVAPQQSMQQAGASTLLGQAFANPVSGRLQRLFGVSKLKIDPQITGTSNTPQATLTLQQQVTREISFTYIQDVTQSNSQVIRVEWAINPQWSAVAVRDYNGGFDVNLFYKRRFR